MEHLVSMLFVKPITLELKKEEYKVKRFQLLFRKVAALQLVNWRLKKKKNL
jgi:hypothetical protein